MAATLFKFDKDAGRIILKEELQALKGSIINNMRAANEVASGRTIASLHVTDEQERATLWGHFPFGVLETGRKAGKVPYGFGQIILQWLNDKGLHGEPIPYKTDRPHKYSPQERGDLSMAYAIAYTIKQKGSSLHRKGGRADIYSNVIPATLERVRSRFMKFMKLQVEESIKINIKKGNK